MTPDNVYDWAKAIGILGAILFGGFAVFSPSWVWFKRNVFGWGGAVLCGFGTVLLVSPIFRNIQFVVDTNKLELKLSALETKLGEVSASVAALTTNMDRSGMVTTASVGGLNEKLQGIEKSVAGLQASISNVDQIGASVAALTASVNSRGTVGTADFDKLNARLRNIESSFAGFETAISNVSSLGDRIKGVEKAAAEISKSTKSLNFVYPTGPSPTYANSDVDWLDLYQPSKKLYGFKTWPSEAKYPQVGFSLGKEILLLPPNNETLPAYDRLMKALLNLPEYQQYVETLRKTDPDVLKWGGIDLKGSTITPFPGNR